MPLKSTTHFHIRFPPPGSPGGDGLQFKSVFIRHLNYLYKLVTSHAAAVSVVGSVATDEWRAAIGDNADAIWQKAACAPAAPIAAGAALLVPPLFGYLWHADQG